MANRHERRRSAKLLGYSEMKVEEVLKLPSGCAWDGCCKVTNDPYAAGWSSMLLYKGRPKLNFLEIDERNMARDSVLCPEHASYLDEHLLIDIGGRLRVTMGAA